jgi:hypothetical protein
MIRKGDRAAKKDQAAGYSGHGQRTRPGVARRPRSAALMERFDDEVSATNENWDPHQNGHRESRHGCLLSCSGRINALIKLRFKSGSSRKSREVPAGRRSFRPGVMESPCLSAFRGKLLGCCATTDRNVLSMVVFTGRSRATSPPPTGTGCMKGSASQPQAFFISA